jgi:hypothetical protein
MFGIRRREFITLLGGPAATWPLAAGAQQAAKLPSIGALVIGNTNPEQFWRAFRQGLCDWGIMRGKHSILVSMGARTGQSASRIGRRVGPSQFEATGSLSEQVEGGTEGTALDFCYCWTPSTAKMRKSAYLLPTFSWMSRPPPSHQPFTTSTLANWRMPTRLGSGAPDRLMALS